MAYALKHISIRVPWHDTGWDGQVCANPSLNGSCLKLKRIGQNRDDAAEQAVPGLNIRVIVGSITFLKRINYRRSSDR